MQKDTFLQQASEAFPKNTPLQLKPNSALKKMTDFKDFGLPKIPEKELTASKISLALEEKKTKRVTFLADTNCMIRSLDKVQRPMTAISVTRKGEIKHTLVPAIPSVNLRKHASDQDKRELVVVLPSDQNNGQHGPLPDLDSQNEPYSRKLSKISVLHPLNETRKTRGENSKIENLFQKDKNNVNVQGLRDPRENTMLPSRLSKKQSTEYSCLPFIFDSDFKRTCVRRVTRDHGIELVKHLNQADQDYDECVAKASILYNWLSSQNKLKESPACS